MPPVQHLSRVLRVLVPVMVCGISAMSVPHTSAGIAVAASPAPPTWTPYVVYVTATPRSNVPIAPPTPTLGPPTWTPYVVYVTATPGGSARSATPPSGTPQVLRLAHRAFPDRLDPQRSIYSNEINVLALCYEGLTSIDAKGQVGPGAADRYQLAADGFSMTFHIREGLVRADGTPINASDYEYALKRQVDPRVVGKEYATIMLDVKGASPLIEAEGKTLTDAELTGLYTNFGVRANDATRTLTVAFSKATSFWHAIASTFATFPPDKRRVDADPTGWWRKASGHNCNGPFVIQSIEEPTRIVHVANPNYWRGRPKLDRVEATYVADEAVQLDGYRKGQYDIVAVTGDTLDLVRADPALSVDVVRYPAAHTGAVLFNAARRPFTDRNVRAAFSQALDRVGWVQTFYQGIGKPYTRWIPPGSVGAQPEKPGAPGTDPKGAVATLVRNGYGVADGSRVDCAKLGEVKLMYGSSPQTDARFRFLADNWTRVLGCPITLDPVDPNIVVRLSRDPATAPQVQTGGWVADYPHPQNWMSVWFHCIGRIARLGYCNSALDDMLYRADAIFETDDAIRAYQQAEDMMLQDVPIAPTQYYENVYLVKPYLIGPKNNLSPSDDEWAGQRGPIWEYEIDWTRAPSTPSIAVQPPSTVSPSPRASSMVPSFGPIIFSNQVEPVSYKPLNPGLWFASPVGILYASWRVTGATPGTTFRYEWWVDGELFDSGNGQWGIAEGTYMDTAFRLDGQPLPPGTWSLVIKMDGQAVLWGQCTIQPAPTVRAPTRRPSTAVPTPAPAVSPCGSIPDGMAGMYADNAYGWEVLLDVGPKLIKIPPNGRSEPAYFSPGKYKWVAKFNKTAQTSSQSIGGTWEAVAGECRRFSFSDGAGSNKRVSAHVPSAQPFHAFIPGGANAHPSL